MGNPPANVGFNPWSSKTPQVIERQSPCLTTPKPVLRSLGAAATEAHGPQKPCSATREVAATRSPHTTATEEPLLPTAGEKLEQH